MEGNSSRVLGHGTGPAILARRRAPGARAALCPSVGSCAAVPGGAENRNGQSRGPAPSMAQGPRTDRRAPTKRIPGFSRGRCPRTPAIPGFCALFVRSPRLAGGHGGALCPCRVVAARRRGLSCPRWAAWRIPAPRSALRRRPGPCSCALAPSGPGAGGAGLGSLPSLSPAPGGRFRRSRRRGAGGSWVRWCFLGVSCGRFLVCPFRFRRAAFRAVCVRALGGFRPRRFVPPVRCGVVRFGGRGPFFLARRRRPVRAVVGRAPARGLSGLSGSPGSRRCGRCAVLGGFRPGGAAARSRSPGWRFARPGRRVRRPVRGGRVVVAGLLSVFAAGLPAACRARPAPGLAGVLFVACPSRVAAGAASRRARWFGLRVLACRARGPGWLVAVALPLAPRPCPVSRRLGTFAPGGAPALPGLPLPVPPRGGFSRSLSRSVPVVSFHQGRLF